MIEGGEKSGLDPTDDSNDSLELPNGYVEPDWSKLLSIDHYRRNTPRDVRLRGHFFSLVQNQAREAGIPLCDQDRYYSFKLYPVHRFYDLVEDAIPALYPDDTIRTALRMLGQRAYPSFFQTRMGRMLFAAFGNNVSLIYRAARRGYALTISTGSAEALEYSSRHVILAVRDMYTFVDSYHVGLMEGVLTHHDCIGRVGIERLSDTDVNMAIVWQHR